MPIVTVKNNEPLDKALKRLSKIVTKEGIIQTVKQKRFYEKPSEKKRKAKASAIKNKKKSY